MTPAEPMALTGSLVLAEFTDPLRALVTEQALNPAEVQELADGNNAAQVLEASGRRLLALYLDPAAALDFARAVQALAARIRSRDPQRHSLAARVIAGHGRLAIENGRARGDWPHRLAGLLPRVPAHCTAALDNFMDALPPAARPTAPQPLAAGLYLVDSADTAAVETRMASPLASSPGVFSEITLRVRGVQRVFRSSDCPLLVGRESRCAVQLASDTASRVHGRIEHGGGKFYYVDDSRNGSWVLLGSGEEIALRKDRVVLAGDGAISPGAPLAQQRGEVLRFSCHSTRLTMSGDAGDTRPLEPGK